MDKPPVWVIALILSIFGISVFSLLCVTAIQLQEGNLQIRFEALGVKVDAGVEKGKDPVADEKPLLLEDGKGDRCSN